MPRPIHNITKSEVVVHNYLFVNARDAYYRRGGRHTASLKTRRIRRYVTARRTAIKGGGGGVITEAGLERGSQHTVAWHTLPIGVATEQLATTLTGLERPEAARRLGIHGPNELQALSRQSAWRTLFEQFQNALILILLSAPIISGFLAHTLEGIVII